MTDIQKFRAFVPNDDLEKRLAEFVEQNNNFNGDDVRAILLRVDRLRVAFNLATAARVGQDLIPDTEVPKGCKEYIDGTIVWDDGDNFIEVNVEDGDVSLVTTENHDPLTSGCRIDIPLAPVLYRLAKSGFILTNFSTQNSTIDELIEDSSLGTPGAKVIRNRTPDRVVDEVMSKIKKKQEG